jgi:y4mF family transcriptional regulator
MAVNNGECVKEVAEYVKKKRKQAKLTQVELAERAGVGLRFVRELEGAKKTLRCDTVNQVLALFGSTLVPSKNNEIK